MRPTAAGLTAGEKFDRFKLEAMTEVVLRVAGILMVMGSILLWFLLPLDEATGRVVTHSALASFMAAAGLGVFAYGTRGFRRQLSLDIEKGTLSLTKININDQARMSRTIDLGDRKRLFAPPRDARRAGHASGAGAWHVCPGHRPQRIDE